MENKRKDHPDSYEWFVKIDLSDPTNFIVCEGDCGIIRENKQTKVLVSSEGDEHVLISIENSAGKIKIISFPGGISRCYARIRSNYLLLGNFVTSLFERNEKVALNGEVLLRQICDLVTPIDDLFSDVTLLASSSIFHIEDKEIVLEDSTIKPVESTADSVSQIILDEFDKICRSGKPLAVLLSAGIDSRLNLALCYHFSKIYQNEVIAYHEYKDKKEHDIAKRLTDMIKVPFISVSRDRFKREPVEVSLSPDFIEFHGGLCRESIVRWVPFLDWIRQANPDCVIIGMGAEAHKGKFYRDIKNLPKDSRNILGISLRINPAEEDFMCYVSDENMNAFFKTLSRQALVFNDLSSQVDFVHYHAYAAKHSMARSPYLNMRYGFQFPFLGDVFLSQVFSLPLEEKKDAKISKDLIKKLVPPFLNIPFISGNQKGFQSHYLNLLKEVITYLMPRFIDTGRRNEDISWNSPAILERLEGASSEITIKLQKFIKKNIRTERKSNIKIRCALRMYLFLRQAEKDLGVEFICK